MRMECTIIIPTLEMALPFTDFLMGELDKSKKTKKIIFINNRKEPTLSKRYSEYKKSIFIDDMPNLVVNPAWNYGMTLCDTKYYLLLNDDLVLHGELIDEIINLLEKDDSLNLTTINTYRLFGEPSKLIETMKKDFLKSKLSLPLRYKKVIYPEYKQGWFMMGRTSAWNPIKNCGLLMSGDDFTYQRNLESHGFAVFIENNHCWHCESSSSGFVSHGKTFIIDQIAKPHDPDYELKIKEKL